MEKLNIEKVASFCDGEIILRGNDDNLDILEVSIDSRSVSSLSLFVPIIGDVHDGHKFMESAYENGCFNFLIDKNHEFYKDDINLIRVDDTRESFGKIAKGYRDGFDLSLIGITGSVGKTSCKDIIYSILNVRGNSIKTIGNLNNDIGMPKTLFTINKDTKYAVVEMGMDKKGEISYLSKLASPDIGVITNIGMSHIEHFDNQEGIFDAKMEILDGLKDDGILIVNGDDKFLKGLKNKDLDCKLITCGFDSCNDIYCSSYEISSSGISFVCNYLDKDYSFFIPSIAKHNILNALFGIVIGFIYGYSYEEIKEGLLQFELSSNRLDIINTSKYRIINDTYNASYDSVISAVNVLNTFSGRKVAIIGDILELGKFSEEVHRNIGKNINLDVVIAIGNDAKYIYEESKKRVCSYYYSSKEEFYKEMNNIIMDGDNILVKASNGMKFGDIVDKLKD